jgi:hypothetical protein
VFLIIELPKGKMKPFVFIIMASEFLGIFSYVPFHRRTRATQTSVDCASLSAWKNIDKVYSFLFLSSKEPRKNNFSY